LPLEHKLVSYEKVRTVITSET